MKRKPIIISISSYKLTNNEKSLISTEKPWGIILFKRNIKNLSQLKYLTFNIRKLMRDPYYPIIVDEEGGNVSRLSDIINTKKFNSSFFGKLFEKNKREGKNAYMEYLFFVSGILKEVGINVNTIPVLDVLKNITHKVIGNRSFSKNIETIISFKKICSDILKKNKIGSVSKHIPGHGCVNVDTHKNLAITNLSENTLFEKDFKVFKNINSNFAMTAHIIYKKIDPINPATHSNIIINNIIRNKLGFKGILMSDDISMGALGKNILHNSKKAISSGCNLVLYCNGNINESSLLLRNLGNIDKFTKKKTSEFYSFLR